jgi:hypothetical protein
MFGFTAFQEVSPVIEYSIEYVTDRDAFASPLIVGVKTVLASRLDIGFVPPCPICQANLMGRNLICAGRVSILVFSVWNLADE